MTLCAISLGGNVGDVPGTFAAAVHRLSSTPGLTELRMSRLYRTKPMGSAAGEVFHNAACVFETSLPPFAVLDHLQDIETSCGRVRTVHWGPRTLDLDLLLYGTDIISSPPMASAGPVLQGSAQAARLTVPHPALWYRRFVLDPLVELIPDVVHPVFRQTIHTLRQRLLVRPLLVRLDIVPSGSLDWVEAVMAMEEQLGSTLANAEIKWISDVELDSENAVLVFTAGSAVTNAPYALRLPENSSAAAQWMTDVLTAALDEPVPVT